MKFAGYVLMLDDAVQWRCLYHSKFHGNRFLNTNPGAVVKSVSKVYGLQSLAAAYIPKRSLHTKTAGDDQVLSKLLFNVNELLSRREER